MTEMKSVKNSEFFRDTLKYIDDQQSLMFAQVCLLKSKEENFTQLQVSLVHLLYSAYWSTFNVRCVMSWPFLFKIEICTIYLPPFLR